MLKKNLEFHPNIFKHHQRSHGTCQIPCQNNGGHDDKWFHMSLGLKEGCPAAPIEFSIYHSFIMKELKARMLEKSRESIRVGFGTEEFNDLPLIRENAPDKENQVGKKSRANIEVHRPPLVRRRYDEFVPEVKYAEPQRDSEKRPSRTGSSS